jgi:hypothetical protein
MQNKVQHTASNATVATIIQKLVAILRMIADLVMSESTRKRKEPALVTIVRWESIVGRSRQPKPRYASLVTLERSHQR